MVSCVASKEMACHKTCGNWHNYLWLPVNSIQVAELPEYKWLKSTSESLVPKTIFLSVSISQVYTRCGADTHVYFARVDKTAETN